MDGFIDSKVGTEGGWVGFLLLFCLLFLIVKFIKV